MKKIALILIIGTMIVCAFILLTIRGKSNELVGIWKMEDGNRILFGASIEFKSGGKYIEITDGVKKRGRYRMKKNGKIEINHVVYSYELGGGALVLYHPVAGAYATYNKIED